MEPDVTPMHSSTPPPLDDNVDVGAEDEEFGDFGSFSVGVLSTLSFGHFTESSISQPCPATRLPSSSFNNPVEQYQPTSTVTSGIGRGQIEIKGKHCNADTPHHLTNGGLERGHPPEHSDLASVMGACSLGEETGFGLGFGEQAVHPWCCGFSPVGGGENWNGRAVGTNPANSSAESQCDSTGQEVDADSEPRSHTAKEKTKDCTKVKHCEQRDTTLIQSSQDHLPQDPATVASQSEECHPREEEPVDPGVSRRGQSFNIKPPQTNQTEEELQSEGEGEDGEESVSPLPLTSSESVSEDFASFCDVVSPEEVLEGFDSSLLSPAPREDGAEDLREGTDEEEDSGNIRHTVSISSQGFANLSLSQSEAEEGFADFDQPAPTLQEASPDFIQSEWRTDVEEDFTDFDRVGSGDQSVQDHDQRNNATDQGPSSPQPSLPPSDSFADFCSAATEEEEEEGRGGGCWEAFKDQKGLMEAKMWAPFGEDGGVEDKRDRGQGDDSTRRDRGQEDDSTRRDRGQEDDSTRRDRGQEDDSTSRDRGQEDDSTRRDRGQEDDSTRRDRGQEDDSTRRDRGQEDDSTRRDRGQGDDSTRRDSEQDLLASCVQRIFQASFPIVEVQRVLEDDDEEEVEVLSLRAVLEVPENQPEKDQEERPEEEEEEQQLRPKRVQGAMWRQPQDVHNAVGLKFQWGGSHSNRSLLRCLGMDIRNIVFSGQTKQPVIVPAFASNLGMLEPTKESVAVVGSPGRTRVTSVGSPGRTRVTGVGSPGRTRVTVPEPLGSRDRRSPKQQTPPPRQRAWSSSGLSSSEDGSRDNTELNLDYFGPVEDTSSRSSGCNSPPPGLDWELYELSVTKLEANIDTSHLEETFNRLMSTAKTSSCVRSAQQGEQLSQEAVKVMEELPCLSFMKATVLMFPSILIPCEGGASLD